MKIVFMGTPAFAKAALEAIVAAGHEVVCVVTQPDRPKGRGREVCFTPVKKAALAHHIPVLAPTRIRTPEAVRQLSEYEADLFVVAAFGQILSPEILRMPPYGCINIHASLLPKYRGAAPIQRAILDGETQTGVTIMQMDEGLDTGDMLARVIVPIQPADTADSLHDKLMEAGARLVVETIPLIREGKLIPEKQKDEDSTYAHMLRKSDGKIDWDKDAQTLERLVRGLDSWPGAYTRFRGKNLKIWEAAVKSAARETTADAETEKQAGTAKSAPGTVTEVTKETIEVQTGEGILILTSVQPEGKKRMPVKDFLLGYPVKPGEYFGA